ncbi:MAG: hypothetical protein AAF726_12410 [Planctomycetota bacterium]
MLVLSIATALAAQGLPERPSVWREVTPIIDVGGPLESDHDPRFQGPHLPPFRTTQDGRLAITVEGVPRLTLLTPEKLARRGDGAPLMLQPAGEDAMRWSGWAFVEGDAASQADALTGGTGREIVHSCLWDDELPRRGSDGRDIYRVKVLVTTRGGGGSVQLFMTPVVVEVENPKTSVARIAEAYVDGPTIVGPDFANNGAATFHSTGAFEPTICGDGRLLVFRVRSSDVPTPNGPASIDVVYSYYEDPTGTLGTANPAGWTEVLPIAHAYHDPRVNRPLDQGGFGFARYPLRDTAGTVVPEWEDAGVAYPWMDREAANLFFTTIADSLHVQDPNPLYPSRDPRSAAEWQTTRYEAVGVPGDLRARWGAESQENFQGVAFAGLWTRGKTVLLDGLLNDMDYAIGSSKAGSYGGTPYNVGPQQRLVRLFEGSATPSLDPASGWVRLGYGRATRSDGLPAGDNGNTSVIDSLESKLLLSNRARPLALRDVVWHVQNGKHADEVAFDDYVDPGALIVADMTGHLSLPDLTGTSYNEVEHHSGWNAVTRAFDLPVRLQNAATNVNGWDLPAFGELVDGTSGRARLEPAALGGVYGRGLWLEDGAALAFDAPNDVTGASPDAFYAGVFVDCRFDDDGARRRLIGFPDGTALDLAGRSGVLFVDGERIVHRVALPDDVTYVRSGGGRPQTHSYLGRGAWTHLGLEIEDSGRRVTLLVDGFPFDRWQDPERRLFQPLASAGSVTLGGPATGTSATFRGWLDELRLFAHDADAETAANYARGTLIGFDRDAASNAWEQRVAAGFPDWAHEEISEALRGRGEETYERYASFVDPTRDLGVHRESLPENTVHLRNAMHFPEGPLYFDRPRPDSTTNRFCLSCHAADADGGLTIDALAYRPGLTALRDPRRQPSQPPALVGGALPNGFIDAGSTPRPRPGDPRAADGKPFPVDRWLLQEFGDRAARVESLTIVADGRDVGPLEEGATLDPAVLGADAIDIRADLDVGQGVAGLVLRERVGGQSVVRAERVAPHGPYRLFGDGGGSFALLPGSYEIEVKPANGASVVRSFDVVPAGPRRIARIREAFQAGSPRDDWFVRWNDVGASDDPGEFVALAWDPTTNRYGGTNFGGARLDAFGGRPGRGSTQVPAGEDERIVAVGYRARARGHYRIGDLGQTQVSGGAITVRVLVRTARTGTTTVLFEQGLPAGGTPTVTSLPALLDAGDVLWIVVAPGATSAGDAFTWDFDVEYGEASWAQAFD